MLVSYSTWTAIVAVAIVTVLAGAIGGAWAIQQRVSRRRIAIAFGAGAAGLVVGLFAWLGSTEVYECTEPDGRVHVRHAIELFTGGERTKVINHSARAVRVEVFSYGEGTDLDTRTVVILPGKEGLLDVDIEYVGPLQTPPETVRMRAKPAVRYWLTWDGGPESQAR